MWKDSNRQPRPGVVSRLTDAIASFRSLAVISFILSVISRSYFTASTRSSLDSVLPANKVPPNIRERLNSERLLQTGHLSFELVLTTSQSIHNTAFCMEMKFRSEPASTCTEGPLSIVGTTEDSTCLRVACGWVGELPQEECSEFQGREVFQQQTVLLWSCHIAGNSISTVTLRFVECRVSTLQQDFQALHATRLEGRDPDRYG